MNTPDFKPGQVNTYRTATEVNALSRALHGVGRRVALVPTMGALHSGHRALFDKARRQQNTVLAASIFVNPLQFGAGEDFEDYPRSLDTDLEMLSAAGTEIAFTPRVSDLYAENASITVHPGPLAEELEGSSRPGHFAGVLTVVAKLLNIVRPDYALFGEKDYQQLVLLRRMVRDLNFDTSVLGVPTVRESDGLALSSRNAYLSESERNQAVGLSAALTAGARAGPEGPEAVLTQAKRTLAACPDLELEYLQLRDPDLGPAPEQGQARLLIAGRIGGTRLIDNVAVWLGPGEPETKNAQG